MYHTEGCHPHGKLAFDPERFLGDTLTCAETSNVTNAMDRDHSSTRAYKSQKGAVSSNVRVTLGVRNLITT